MLTPVNTFLWALLGESGGGGGGGGGGWWKQSPVGVLLTD